jgi:hypothetical protein
MRRSKALKDEGQNGPPIWLISFTDVIALMLTFFVLLYAISEPEVERYQQKLGVTVFDSAEFKGTPLQAGNDEGLNISRMNFGLAEDLEYLKALLNQALMDRKLTNKIIIEGNKNHLYINPNKNMQVSNREFIFFLNRLENFFESLDNQITLVSYYRDQGSGLREMQSLGGILRDMRYRKPIDIRMASPSESKNDALFAIAIQSNDGRRVAP